MSDDFTKRIVRDIATDLTDEFDKNFERQGFFGQKWKNVKRRTNPPKRSKHPADANRKILTEILGDGIVAGYRLSW